MSEPPRFGALTLPNEPWPDLVARWQRLEDGGLDSIWSCDHFTNPHKPGQPWFEGWAGLAALAGATSRVRVGLLVGAIVSRSPTLFARQAQTVDHISGGRLELGLGAGGALTDQPMWGVKAWSDGERAARFAEYVELVDRMLHHDEVTFHGQWYRTEGALMSPGFVQQPAPPWVLAAHGARTLAVAARFASTWNTFGPTLADAVEHGHRLVEACAAIGRDPATIRWSVLLGITEGTAWTSAGEFTDVVSAWWEAGFREFIFYDPPYGRGDVRVAEPAMIDELLGSTIPDLRRSLA